MRSLYEIVSATVNSESMDIAKEILFGFDEFSANIDEYYKRIISTFVKKKDIIIKQENGKLIFDLENVNDLWSVLFISEYIRKEIEKLELQIEQQIDELQKEYEMLQQRAKVERINLGKELKKIGKQKRMLERQRDEEIQKCKSGFFSLDTFPYSIEFEQNISIKQEALKIIKESIKSIHILRNIVEHGNAQNKKDIIIDNYGVQITIPSTYLDGFNKGKIIAREEDKIIVEKTNKIIYPILEIFGYDVKKIESFFYNLEPSYLSYLLKLCDYKTENLYRLPFELFYQKDSLVIIISVLMESKSTNVFQEEDYDFLNNLDYELNSTYVNNMMLLLRNNNRLKFDLKELPLIAKIFTEAGKDVLINEEDIPEANKILNNYLKIKKDFSGYLKIFSLYDLPYSIFCMPFDEQSNEYIKKIIKIKQLINTEDNEYKEEMNYWFNNFIKDQNLFVFLDDIIDLFENISDYAPDKNPNQYVSSLLIDIVGRQIFRMNANSPYKFKDIDLDDKKIIDEIIKKYKNNYDIPYVLEKDNKKNSKRELNNYSKSKKEDLLNIIKELKEKNLSISSYLKQLNVDDNEYISFLQISWLEQELYYLIDITNNYETSLEIIMKIAQNIHEDTIGFNKRNDYNYDDFYLKKVEDVKHNFKRNIDRMLSKYEPEDLLKFPSEIYYSSDIMFDILFSQYNENLCKSIFGIENPKIIGTLLYANSVFSQYQKEDLKLLDINFDTVIHNCFNDTYIFRHNITDVAITQESYLEQFLLNGNEQRDLQNIKSNIMNKLRNSFAHFRFKPVKDKNGNIVPDKIYLYDKYEESNSNNFNIIIDLRDLVKLTRQVEIGLSKKSGLFIDNTEENKFKTR